MEILIIIAICVGVLCFAAILMVGAKVKNSSAGQNEKRLEEISRSIVRLEGAVGESSRLVQAQEARIADMRNKMDADLKYIAETTSASVERIRLSVEDKLSSTLDARLSKSYSVINEQLEKVYKGIGEVNTLAANVTDIKKLFSNVRCPQMVSAIFRGAL